MTASSGRKTSSSNRKTTKSTGRKTSARRKKEEEARAAQNRALYHEIGLIVLFAAMVFLFCCNFGIVGPVGDAVSGVLFGLFGLSAYVLPVLLFLAAAFWCANEGNPSAVRKLAAGAVLFVMFGIVCDLVAKGSAGMEEYSAALLYENCRETKYGGGIIGGSISYFLQGYLETIGTVLVVLLGTVVSLILLTEKSLLGSVKRGGSRMREIRREDAARRREMAQARRAEQEESAGRRRRRAEEDFEEEEPEEIPVRESRRKGRDRGPGEEESGSRRRNHEEQRARKAQERRLRAEEKENERILHPDRKKASITLDERFFKSEGSRRHRDDMHEITLSPEELGIGQPAGDAVPEGAESSVSGIPAAHGTERRKQEGWEEYRAPETVQPVIRIHKAGAEGDAVPAEGGEAVYAAVADPGLEQEAFAGPEGVPVDAGEPVPGESSQVSPEDFYRMEGGRVQPESLLRPGEMYGSGGSSQLSEETEAAVDSPLRPKDTVRPEGFYGTEGGRVQPESLLHPGEIYGSGGSSQRPEETVDSFLRPKDTVRPEAFYGAEGGSAQPDSPARPGAFHGTEDGSAHPEAFYGTEGGSAQPDSPVRPGAFHGMQGGSAQPGSPAHSETFHGTEGGRVQPEETPQARPLPRAEVHGTGNAPVRQESPVPKKYMFPPISLLQKGVAVTGESERELRDTAMHLQQTLGTFGVKVTITDISQGPSVTRYELQPEQGVKVSKIVGLSDDIKLNLAAMDIRIEAPIPGKAAIGIEVPNKETMPVALRDLFETREFREFPSNITFAVGKDIAGKVVVSDIAKMPHMLIAGATGSGKSVCINTLIMSILYKAHPDDVKLIMVDPKVVELSIYNGIPHLLVPVVTDPKKASAALHWGVSEMDDRYRKFAEYNVRDLKGYNKKVEAQREKGDSNAPKKLPQIVIIVDELADLMMVCPGEVEESICRLAQLARACGIHLIIATQRPSVDVITGLIKANMPSRVAFSVSSGVDSRTILDMVGAEKLLGKGDMLFYPQGYPKPARVQGAFVSDQEVSDVVDFLKNQTLGNVYAEEIEAEIANMGSSQGGGRASGGSDVDELFERAGRLIIDKDKASIGMLQRALQIGFNRAARIMDQLCQYGVVGEEEGTKPRKILMSPEQFEQLLEEVA